MNSFATNESPKHFSILMDHQGPAKGKIDHLL